MKNIEKKRKIEKLRQKVLKLVKENDNKKFNGLINFGGNFISQAIDRTGRILKVK